jgi:hypothetical protein
VGPATFDDGVEGMHPATTGSRPNSRSSLKNHACWLDIFSSKKIFERAEVRRLNDEIKEMVKRERELVDMLLEVQTRRRKDGDSSEERQKENVIQKKEGKTRMRIERSNSKSKGQKGKLQVVRWKTPSGA